jgi:hypothetical protein
MTKRFHLDSPSERYLADAAVMWCFDGRFPPVVKEVFEAERHRRCRLDPG